MQTWIMLVIALFLSLSVLYFFGKQFMENHEGSVHSDIMERMGHWKNLTIIASIPCIMYITSSNGERIKYAIISFVTTTLVVLVLCVFKEIDRKDEFFKIPKKVESDVRFGVIDFFTSVYTYKVLVIVLFASWVIITTTCWQQTASTVKCEVQGMIRKIPEGTQWSWVEKECFQPTANGSLIPLRNFRGFTEMADDDSGDMSSIADSNGMN